MILRSIFNFVFAPRISGGIIIRQTNAKGFVDHINGHNKKRIKVIILHKHIDIQYSNKPGAEYELLDINYKY